MAGKDITSVSLPAGAARPAGGRCHGAAIRPQSSRQYRRPLNNPIRACKQRTRLPATPLRDALARFVMDINTRYLNQFWVGPEGPGREWRGGVTGGNPARNARRMPAWSRVSKNIPLAKGPAGPAALNPTSLRHGHWAIFPGPLRSDPIHE